MIRLRMNSESCLHWLLVGLAILIFILGLVGADLKSNVSCVFTTPSGDTR